MHIEIHQADRSTLLPLFALADDSPAQIAGYIALGEVLAAREGRRHQCPAEFEAGLRRRSGST